MSNPNFANPAALAASQQSRPRVTFTIPAAVRQQGDPERVVMQELSVGASLQASQSAQGDDEVRALEMLKHCVVEVDGQPLSWGGPAKDQFVERLSAKVRSLLLKGMVRVNVPQAEDEASFFASMVTTA